MNETTTHTVTVEGVGEFTAEPLPSGMWRVTEPGARMQFGSRGCAMSHLAVRLNEVTRELSPAVREAAEVEIGVALDAI